MTLVLLFLATCLLAYSNGANDNFKGVASLFGSRTCNYGAAISWATFTTFAGSIMSIFLAQTLLKKFSGKGIVPDHFVGSEYFLLAVAIGAGLTVIVATLTGFPISTTHALTGAIIGCGLVGDSKGLDASAHAPKGSAGGALDQGRLRSEGRRRPLRHRRSGRDHPRHAVAPHVRKR